MDLFLFITHQEDPLYLPVELSGLITTSVPKASFFQIDHHASSELIQTANKAINKASKVVFLIEGKNDGPVHKSLFPLFRQMVQVKCPAILLQKGDTSLGIFKNLLSIPRYEVNDFNEVIIRSKEFYDSGQ